jgi:hypothetical protein
MKRLLIAMAVAALGAALLPTTAGAAALSCTPTGFFRDGSNMTAAQIGGDVTTALDAGGCNIGVYYGPGTSGTVNAEVFGANYFGVVARGASVDVTNSHVHNIGEVPFNGAQHGLAIYFATVDTGSATTQPACTTGATTGTISGNTVDAYQKGGIIAACKGTNVEITNNTVIGAGPVDYIAQNGIQISFGGSAKLIGNDVSLNNYTPAKVTACGLLLYKAGGVGASKAGISFIKAENNFHNNETNICNFGKGGGFSA